MQGLIAAFASTAAIAGRTVWAWHCLMSEVIRIRIMATRGFCVLGAEVWRWLSSAPYNKSLRTNLGLQMQIAVTFITAAAMLLVFALQMTR